jgi:hypothetical protein
MVAGSAVASAAAGVVVARHDQHVHGRLRVDVAERHRPLGRVHDLTGHVSGDNLAEETVVHG